jgi:hypothetical protein
MPKIRVLHVGLGPIGAAVAKQISSRAAFAIVGAVDIDPQKVGHDLGDVLGLSQRLKVRVADDLAATITRTRPHVVVHCTSSSLKTVAPQLETILKTRTPIVSTTEELSYPWRAAKRLAAAIDAQAKKAKVAVLSTGVNPGFAMDVMPITISAVCERVDAVHVRRIQDARVRRLPFQQKIGAGLSVEEFEARVAKGTVRHVGFSESIAMIGDALGWPLDRITDDITPKIATEAVSSSKLKVKAGEVCGIVQDGIGYRKGEPVITLHLEAYLGAPESYDAVEIVGSPHLNMKFDGGIHGDVATASMVVNSIPKVIAAAPGLRTMRDLAIPSFFGA